MTTYTDLMILLLTFFVLLLSIATITDEKKRVVLNSLIGAFGFKPGAHSIIGAPKGLNITIGGAPIEKRDIDLQKLRDIALRNEVDLSSDMVISKEQRRTIISLSNKVLFKEGAHQIEPDSLVFLGKLAEVLRSGPKLIELRGYASHSEAVFDPEPLKRSTFLSSKRALAVYHFFREKGEIPAERMVAHGFGIDDKGAGKSKSKRGLVRHVEIILDYREKLPYELRKRREGGSMLDFKGFIFKMADDRSGS